MSGAATIGGAATQANVIALVGAHMLAGEPLGWVKLGAPDVPTAVSGETSGPGDDLAVELLGTSAVLEVQVKQGLRKDNRLRETFGHFLARLPDHPAAYAILAVDPGSHDDVKKRLREDLDRMSHGRDDDLREITKEVLEPFRAAGRMDLVPRISVIELDLQHANSHHRKEALRLLGRILSSSADSNSAWALLVEDALEVCRSRSRRTVVHLRRLLGRKGIAASVTSDVTARPTADERFSAMLDRTKQLLGAGKAATALGFLGHLEADLATEAVGPSIRARLYNHLGSASLKLGRPNDARRYFERVLDYQEPDASSLENLALARLASGDSAGALRDAERALTIAPGSVPAWQTRTNAEHALGRPATDPPPEVSESAEYLTTLARLASVGADWSKAEKLAREALRRGTRNANRLLVLAQAIYNGALASPGQTRELPIRLVVGDRSKSSEAMTRVEELSTEALTLLDKTEFGSERAAALALRGTARRALGRVEDAREDFARALEADPLATDAAVQLGVLLLEVDKPSDALFVLDTHLSKGDKHWSLSHLRGRTLLALGRAVDAEASIAEAIQLVAGGPEENDVGFMSVELLIEGGRTDAAELLLETIREASREWMRQLFRARIADARRDHGASDFAYEAAVASAPDSHKREVQLEWARVLARRGDHGQALTQFEAADAIAGPEAARRHFMRTLYTAGRYERLSQVLDHIAAQGPLPAWAEELAALVAREREDLAGEIAHLEKYVALAPDDVDRATQLAQAYGRQDLRESMARVVRQLRVRSGLTATQLIRLGILSIQVGDDAQGLTTGYRGLRLAPFDYEVQMGYLHLVLSIDDTEDLPDTLPVGSDTHVVIEAADGERAEYLILAEAPADPGRGEALVTDDRVKDLIGLAAGAKVTRYRGTLAEKEFTVKEVKPAAVHAFQQILLNHGKLFPTSTALQMFKLGEQPNVSDLAPFIAGAHARAERAETALKLHEQQLLPLGVIAHALGTEVPAVTASLTRMPGHRLMAEHGEQNAATASL